MDDVWSWITTLPSSGDWTPSDSPPSLQLAASDAGKSILLRADRTAGSDTETLVTFSISLHGLLPSNPTRTLWISDPFPLSSPNPHLLLLRQLLQEVIAAAPSAAAPPPELSPEPVSLAVSDYAKAPAFLSLALLCRLFWLCASDAPADAGFLFFHAIGPTLERALDCKDALRRFLTTAGADREERFMRSLGYMLAKWCILRELQGDPAAATGAALRCIPAGCCPSYAAEIHGLWVLKGFAPVFAMDRIGAGSATGWTAGTAAVKESVLRYGLAHQQLEAVVQLEYSVCLQDPRFIRVGVRVDNIRLHVVRLGFAGRGDDDDGMEQERHFPSRVRVWAGPAIGSAYAAGPSLGRSTGNPEREVEMIRNVKGGFGSGKVPSVKAKSRSSVRSRGRSWRWEQEAEGSAGVFEGVLCDGVTGAEVAAWKPGCSSGGGDPRGGMRRRYSGAGRALSKAGGVVVAGDEVPEGVWWRVGREMEGRVVRWRMGVRVWVSYFPNEMRTGYFETRRVEWREEVDLPLVAGG